LKSAMHQNNLKTSTDHKKDGLYFYF